MAVNTWISAGSTDMNLGSNWSLGTISATDDLTFNATSVVNATASGNLSVNSVTIDALYTGVWSFSGRTLTCAQGFTDNGTVGAHTYGTSLTCNGNSATLRVNPAGTLNAASCSFTLNGTTGMSFQLVKAVYYCGALILGASAIVTLAVSSTSGFSGNPPLTMGTAATLTINTSTTYFKLTSTGNWTSLGAGYTLNGSATLYFVTNSNSITASMPSLTYTGSGSVTLAISDGANTGVIHQLTGAINTGTAAFNCRCVYASTLTTSLNNQNITCGQFYFGNVSAGATWVVNCGSGTISCSSYRDDTYDQLGATVNLQTCQISCAGTFTLGANKTYTVGTSLVTITATASITCNGKSLYSLTVNIASGTCTWADAFAWSGVVTLTSGSLTIAVANTRGTGTIITGGAYAGTITLTGELGFGPTGDSTPWIFAATTVWAGASAVRVRPTSGTGILTINALNLGNARAIILENSSTGAWTFNIAGNLTSKTSGSTCYFLKNTTGQTTFNTLGNALDFTSFYIGNLNATNNVIYNFSSSTITTTYSVDHNYNTGNTIIDLGSSNWNVGTSFTLKSLASVTPGTSTITMLGVGTLTTASKPLNNVVINSSGSVTRGDAIVCVNLTVSGGALIGGSSAITASGTITISASLTMTGTMTCSGTAVSFSGAGTFTTGSMILALTGNAMTFTVNKVVTISRLQTKTSGQSIVWSSTQILTISAYTAGDWGGVAGGRVLWTGTGSIAAPAGVEVYYLYVQNSNNSTGTVINAQNPTTLDMGGNVNWRFSQSRTGQGRKNALLMV